jgi:hypothetical protein
MSDQHDSIKIPVAVRRLLETYSKHDKNNSSELSLPITIKEQNQQAQDMYLKGNLPDVKGTSLLHVLNHDEIHGDTGSNAFLPPEEIEKIAQNFTLSDEVVTELRDSLGDRLDRCAILIEEDEDQDEVKNNHVKLSNLQPALELLKILVGLLSKSHNSTQDKMTQIDKCVQQYNEILQDLKKKKIISPAIKSRYKLEVMPRVRAFYHVNPSMPVGKIFTQKMINSIASVLERYNDITLIEDVTHRGIVLDNTKKTGSFTHSKIVNRTIVLDGISKVFGAARARAAFAFGERSLIAPIAHSLHMRNCTLNGASNAFLEGVYKLDPEKFEAHLVDISEGYQNRLKLIKSVIFGLNILDDTDRRKVKTEFIELFNEDKSNKPSNQKIDYIFSGIPGLKLYSEPEAGFFVLIDFSHYVGKYLGSVRLQSGMDFRNAIYTLADVNTIADIMCYDSPGKDNVYLRYSMSIDSTVDMVEGLLRIKKLLSYTKDNQLFELTTTNSDDFEDSIQPLKSTGLGKPAVTMLKDAKRPGDQKNSIRSSLRLKDRLPTDYQSLNKGGPSISRFLG